MQQHGRPRRMGAIFLVLLGGISYGLVSPFIKMAYDAGYTAIEVTSSQFTTAALILWIGALFQFKGFSLLNRRDLGTLASIGILIACTSIFYYMSLRELDVSLGIVLLFQFTWMTMLIDFLVTRRKPAGSQWMALLLVLVGTLLSVNLWGAGWRNVSMKGLLLGILSAFCYSLFLYLNGRVTSRAPAILNSVVMITVATVGIDLIFPPSYLWKGEMEWGLWIWGMIIGCLGQVFPLLLFTKGIPVVGGSLAAILGAVELPVGVLAAYLLLKEPVAYGQWIGVLLILCGIAVAQRR